MRSQSEKITRQRGVGLTPTGFRKLNQAKLEQESTQGLRRYTLEHLSEHTGLTANTLSKIFSSSSPVDRRTLLYCFSAFNLNLDQEDYFYFQSQKEPSL
jgi:transcriptional regulator with XRE-family HTH domain